MATKMLDSPGRFPIRKRFEVRAGPSADCWRGLPRVVSLSGVPSEYLLPRQAAVDTLRGSLYSQSRSPMSVSKIQIGQLWKKDGTGDIYLITRLYSEALNTMVILRRSGAEGEAQIRVRVDRAAGGQKIPGFTPAQEDEKF